MLLDRQPHLVLDGMVLAARLDWARKGSHRGAPFVAEIVTAAIGETIAVGLDDVLLTAQPAAGHFVGGEATAVANWVNNRKAVPCRRRPRQLRRRSGWTAHAGPERGDAGASGSDRQVWRGVVPALGTTAEPGSMLVTVIGGAGRGVYEIPLGLVIGRVLERRMARPLS